jgi:nicotinamidase-related amidase
VTLTTLDPVAALVVVDLQKGIVSLPTARPAGEVVANAAALAAAFRRHGLPVVLVNVAGAAPGRTEVPRSLRSFPAGWADLVPELDRQPQDHVVTKRSPGAFTATGLDAYLRVRGVTQVVVAGVATSNGVEMTARQAFDLGFNVTLATDAMTDRRAEAHAWAVAEVFPRIGETGTTREIVDLLERRV